MPIITFKTHTFAGQSKFGKIGRVGYLCVDFKDKKKVFK